MLYAYWRARRIVFELSAARKKQKEDKINQELYRRLENGRTLKLQEGNILLRPRNAGTLNSDYPDLIYGCPNNGCRGNPLVSYQSGNEGNGMKCHMCGYTVKGLLQHNITSSAINFFIDEIKKERSEIDVKNL